MCTLVNSKDNEEHPKYTKFKTKVNMPSLVFMKGILSSDHKEFKRVVQSYKIKHEYPLLIVKNESRKVSYKLRVGMEKIGRGYSTLIGYV